MHFYNYFKKHLSKKKKKKLVKLVKKSLKTSLFCYFLLHSLTY